MEQKEVILLKMIKIIKLQLKHFIYYNYNHFTGYMKTYRKKKIINSIVCNIFHVHVKYT